MKGTGTKIVVGIIFFLVLAAAVFGVLRYVTADVTKYVATRDIQPHETINPGDIVSVKIHKSIDKLPSQYLDNSVDIVGAHARTLILANQLISKDLLAEYTPEETSLLSLKSNERIAILTLSTQNIGTPVPVWLLNQLLQPGDTIDLTAVTQDGRSKTFAQGVVVLGMVTGADSSTQTQSNQQNQNNSQNSGAAVVEVNIMLKLTPDLVEQIAGAMSGGNVYVSMDPYNFQIVGTTGSNVNTLVGGSSGTGTSVPNISGGR